MTRTPKILVASSVAVVAAAAVAGWDSTNFTMAERRWQPAPSDHVVGKDSSPLGVDGSHHPGEDCGICHAPAIPGGDPGGLNTTYQPAARARVFTLTATIVDSRAARFPIPGGEVVVQDYDGKVLSMKADDVGNAWTDAPIGFDPRVGGSTDTAAWRYKAWVRAEGGARPMMTIPPVGGMSVPRMSCGMHHVGTGTMGGLWASPRGTLRDPPAANVSYRKHVHAILRSKCAPCHVPGPTAASQAGETFDYGADLDLMNLDGSMVVLHDSAGGTTTYAKAGVRSAVNVVSPDASVLLTKTLEGSTHGGGVFWNRTSADYQVIRQWILEGASDN
jgi:mono/diheme cytochrome c family protein/cytochrome c5